MNKPKISVIIPCYNEEKILHVVLNSMKNQSFQNFELIIVDNNSTDKTATIAKQYTPHLYLCKEQGISSARNFGAQKASGEILCFIDADAVVSKHWVRGIHKAFRNKRLQGLSGLNIFHSRNPIKYCCYNLYNAIAFTILFLGNKIGQYFIAGNNCAIRKELFHRVGGFPKLVAEDVRMSILMRKFKGLRIGFNPFMKIEYSPRRFEMKGFLKTLAYWTAAVRREISEKEYKENY